ncbi:MAG: Cof-type HAD-IIB family hydrolase [Clostridiales bacterium]|jgi:Cof subfamily protein (haloacid dehalogenase superfamily)|nr:Cof-type HAD-IIB family hydrolase [Clostridiales bacterium]
MSYRLIVSDLDGTLLNDQSEITPSVKKSVSDAEAAGALFALGSGRSYVSLGYFERELGLDVAGHYGICYNGGMVYKTDSHEVLLENRLDRDLALEIVEALRRHDAHILVYVNDTLYAESADSFTLRYSRLAKMPLTHASRFSDIKTDISKVLIVGEYEDLRSVWSNMESFVHGKANLFFTSSNLLEFCHLKAHKGFALAFLRDHLGLSPSETIAIGDHLNDLTMLREAGLGIAVANAVPEAKAAADVAIEKTNNENAIGFLVEKYIHGAGAL